MTTRTNWSNDLERSYSGVPVLVTGHTGFKGSWLVSWLELLGARVSGFALAPTNPSLYRLLESGLQCRSVLADLRDYEAVKSAIVTARPRLIFHLAAQALVRTSYEQPLQTIATNVLGTAHVLEAVRALRAPCGVVVVTSDKCYQNNEWSFAYRENDPLGGHDVYSMSKSATELVAASYRNSFFPPDRFDQHQVAVASARAGNVIGGGDWAKDRIIPDAMTALTQSRPVRVRNPASTRPWQHVLEPLGGYLLLGQKLLEVTRQDAASICQAWNFGPREEACVSVRELVAETIAVWGSGEWTDAEEAGAPHESKMLRLAIDKARVELGWTPAWTFKEAIRRTVEWYRGHHIAGDRFDAAAACHEQIRDYMRAQAPEPQP